MSNKENHLQDLLSSLPEEERIILTLFYVKSQTAEEIASLLGVPMRAVESVLQMGRQRLLAALGIEGG
jgi:RNA polymerase sigma factor (sigma-70 family)